MYITKLQLYLTELFWKIFEKSFNLDQSQICISNGLEFRALQREALICENPFLYRDCKTEMGNVFTKTNVISKPKKKKDSNIRLAQKKYF